MRSKSSVHDERRENNFNMIYTRQACLVFIFLMYSNADFGFKPMCNPNNPQSYDPDMKVCCNGTLHDKRAPNGTVFACCSRKDVHGVLYDEGAQICCGSYLVPKFDDYGEERTCCKGTNENEFPGNIRGKNKLCCEGKVYEPKDFLGCCDAMDFNVGEAICCYDDISKTAKLHNQAPVETLDCCGTDLFNVSKEHCLVKESEGQEKYIVRLHNIRIHKGHEYDSKKQVPCDDDEDKPTFLPLPEQNLKYPVSYSCCNKSLYDESRYACCPANARKGVQQHIIIKDDVCCGNSSVKKSDQEKCCNEVPNKITEFDDNKSYQCCGTVWTSHNRCCNGELLSLEYACCGGKEYNRNKPLACCGDQIYSLNDEVCCALSSSIKFPKPKEQPDHNDCCWMTLTSYNNMTQMCNNNGVVEKPSPQVKPSQPQCPYCNTDVSTSLCDKKRVFVVNMTDIKVRPKGTIITGQVKPGKPIKIRTPFQCQCLEKGGVYSIFTNRTGRQRKHKFTLRIEEKDMVIRSKTNDTLQTIQGCDVSKKIQRVIRELLRRKRHRKRHLPYKVDSTASHDSHTTISSRNIAISSTARKIPKTFWYIWGVTYLFVLSQ